MNRAIPQDATIKRTWKRVALTDGDRTAIRERVREIGQRLQDPIKVDKLAAQGAQRSRYSTSLSRSARLQSLAMGPLGLALFFEEMERTLPGEGWGDLARRCLAQVQEGMQIEGPASYGLFSGTSGLLFTTVHLSRSGTLAPEVSQQLATSLFAALDRYFIPKETPDPEIYALTSGAVGIGAALLTLAEQSQPDIAMQVRHYLAGLVYHLSWLALRDRGENLDQFADWYPNPYLHEAQLRWLPEIVYRGSGLRRGLSGLIALLSLVLKSDLDIEEEGLIEALDVLCTRVRDEITRNNQGWLLPQDTAGDHYHRPGECAPFAWCNGVSGMARALWLAGQVLRDEELTTFAQEGLTQAIGSFRQEPLRAGPSLCHGVAGLLQVCTRFAGESEGLTLDEDILAMLHRILELFEPDRPFGYRSFEPEYIRVDTPWLLDGASGVGLALLSLLSPVAPDWDRMLLLS